MTNYYDSELSKLTADDFAASLQIRASEESTKCLNINAESLPFLIEHLTRLVHEHEQAKKGG